MRLRMRLREFAERVSAEPDLFDDERSPSERLRADGGERRGGDEVDERDEADEQGAEEKTDEEESAVDRSDVEITDPGESEPADPKWEKPDLDELPEFEIGGPRAAEGRTTESTTGGQAEDPTAGMPNTARSPEQSRIQTGGTDGYVVALELCARLPDDVRLPEEAAELVPAAVEAELERDVQAFAAAEFDTDSPHVETLSFVEVDDEIWLRLRLGIPPASFEEIDPEEIRAHALEELEGLF